MRFLLAFLALRSGPVVAADRPSFVFIHIDDLGYADIEPFGSKLDRPQPRAPYRRVKR